MLFWMTLMIFSYFMLIKSNPMMKSVNLLLLSLTVGVYYMINSYVILGMFVILVYSGGVMAIVMLITSQMKSAMTVTANTGVSLFFFGLLMLMAFNNLIIKMPLLMAPLNNMVEMFTPTSVFTLIMVMYVIFSVMMYNYFIMKKSYGQIKLMFS